MEKLVREFILSFKLRISMSMDYANIAVALPDYYVHEEGKRPKMLVYHFNSTRLYLYSVILLPPDLQLWSAIR